MIADMLPIDASLRRERLEQAIDRAGIATQGEAAGQCGVTQPVLNDVLSGRRPGLELVKKIADITGVSYEWLRYGDLDKAPDWWQPKQRVRPENLIPQPGAVEIIGRVTAGDGDVSRYEDIVESVEIPPNWKIVQVHGMSAYPVFYPQQLAWVDLSRGARPSEMSEAQYIDLHDNVVVVQAEVKGKRVGLLKRFNYQPDSPLKFALSSLDAGRSSPYIPPDSIDIILPVVGSWWEDPRRPRKKRYHARSVIVKLVDDSAP